MRRSEGVGGELLELVNSAQQKRRIKEGSIIGVATSVAHCSKAYEGLLTSLQANVLEELLHERSDDLLPVRCDLAQQH